MKHLNRGFAFTLALVISACSHNPTVGEQMIHQGKDIEALGEKWEDGNDLVNKGRSKVKSGEHHIKKGKAETAEGNRMIRNGNTRMTNSQKGFHDKYPEVKMEE